MDLGQGEVSEAEPQVVAEATLESLDLAKRPSRVRAFVVAVLDDQPAPSRAADVVDRRVERLHRDLGAVRHRPGSSLGRPSLRGGHSRPLVPVEARRRPVGIDDLRDTCSDWPRLAAHGLAFSSFAGTICAS